MRILIHNYTSILSTEPMYLARSFEIVGHEVHLWNDPNASVFDTFDQFKPDLFITHFQFINNDCIKYLSQNKDIQLVVNCTGATTDQLKSVAANILENNINCPVLFTNAGAGLKYAKTEKIRMESVLPGLDVFLPPQVLPDYKLDIGVVALEPNETIDKAIKNKDTYHLLKLTTSDERDKNFDMPVNILNLRSLYSKYKEITFATPMSIVFSQLFYEATFYADKVSFKLTEEEQPMFDSFLQQVFKEEQTDDISNALKSQIKSNHTCISRAARLCKFLKDSETKLKLEKIRGTI